MSRTLIDFFAPLTYDEVFRAFPVVGESRTRRASFLAGASGPGKIHTLSRRSHSACGVLRGPAVPSISRKLHTALVVLGVGEMGNGYDNLIKASLDSRNDV